ncbi:uncharacterized protein M6B38_129750 [Iris pallida]|uniref:Uncharacterized protein n=1 Tax=Iris pallida TaxID=29817 RepID=A0AAX6G5S6_IRIPA|nr:uncharacterized protein M6B38_129750 [Iris pallida]
MRSKPNQPHDEGSSIIDESIAEKNKFTENNVEVDKLSGDEQIATSDENDADNNDTKRAESLTGSDMPISASSSEESASIVSSASEHQVVEQEVNGTQNDEGSTNKNILDQNEQSPSTKSEEPLPQDSSSNTPSSSVTQALGALTGFDDSTQVAVNTVFGVLEDMIDQFGKASNDENSDGKDNVENQELVNGSEKVDDSNDKSDVESEGSPPSEHPEHSTNNENADSYEEDKRNLNKINSSLTSSVNSCIDQVRKNATVFKDSGNKNLKKIGHAQKFPLDLAGNEFWESPYAAYLHRYYSIPLPTMESLDSDSTTDLYLDPEGGQWKMVDQAGSTLVESGEKLSTNERGQSIHSSSEQIAMENIIEPSYVILDNEYTRSDCQLAEVYNTEDDKQDDAKTEELICLIKGALLDTLKVEVGRRLGVSDLKELESCLVDDLQQVADAVSQAVLHDNKLNSFSDTTNDDLVKFGTIDGDHIVKTISSAVEETGHLRKVLPIGVIIGSSLASLRKYFQVVSPHDDEQIKVFHKPRCGTDLHVDSSKPTSQSRDGLQAGSSNNKRIMVGAVTAALGASALLAHHQEKEFQNVEGHVKLEGTVEEKNQNTIVSSLAEKAMSIAAPGVPTKNGEVDQDRIVAVLTELGQKGGMLRLVGKVALLWGGIRGAMSLTDKLISFLHIANRPLFQRKQKETWEFSSEALKLV